MLTGDDIAVRFRSLQLEIVAALCQMDTKAIFNSDEWQREEGGGGVTMTTEKGGIIEKGGVAFSKVEGKISDSMKSHLNMAGDRFMATGVSIVLHSLHPLHPTIHMNVRYFETDLGEEWFGGGIDLTPMYVDPSGAAKFHWALKEVCDNVDMGWYDRFKRWADDYFYLPHRSETRGVGGIFFDRLIPNDANQKEEFFNFCLNLGRLFPCLYEQQTKEIFPYPTEIQLNWQALRRSRYVEYNLLFDKGTQFGILSNGRTESILLSMPPMAVWKYNYCPPNESVEKQTLERLKKDVDWISFL